MQRKAHLIGIAAAAALGAGLSGMAAAQAIPPSTGPSSSGSASGTATTSGTASGDQFTKLDSDKDGMVSKKEGKKNKDLAGKWDTLDVNKDGKLDQAEFAQFEASGSMSAPAEPAKP